MFRGGLDGHQVNHVDYADFNVGEMLTEQIHGGESFERWNISGAGHHHVGLRPLIIRSPLPNTDSARAMLDGGIHIEKLQCRLLSGDDYVDIVSAAQAVIGHGEQRVCIRWQIDADDVSFLVHNVVDEAGILVGEAVVVLAPDVGGKQIVQ